MKYHKEKYHESSLNPPATTVGVKCDEVDSKASLGKEQTRDSALLDEPMLSNGSNEEILPISVLSMEVYNHIVEVKSADVKELPTSSHSVWRARVFPLPPWRPLSTFSSM